MQQAVKNEVAMMASDGRTMAEITKALGVAPHTVQSVCVAKGVPVPNGELGGGKVAKPYTRRTQHGRKRLTKHGLAEVLRMLRDGSKHSDVAEIVGISQHAVAYQAKAHGINRSEMIAKIARDLVMQGADNAALKRALRTEHLHNIDYHLQKSYGKKVADYRVKYAAQQAAKQGASIGQTTEKPMPYTHTTEGGLKRLTDHGKAEVLRLLREGMRNKEVAEIVGLSIQGVQYEARQHGINRSQRIAEIARDMAMAGESNDAIRRKLRFNEIQSIDYHVNKHYGQKVAAFRPKSAAQQASDAEQSTAYVHVTEGGLKRLTSHGKDEVLRMLKAGRAHTAISEAVGIDRHSVKYYARKHGINRADRLGNIIYGLVKDGADNAAIKSTTGLASQSSVEHFLKKKHGMTVEQLRQKLALEQRDAPAEKPKPKLHVVPDGPKPESFHIDKRGQGGAAEVHALRQAVHALEGRVLALEGRLLAAS